MKLKICETFYKVNLWISGVVGIVLISSSYYVLGKQLFSGTEFSYLAVLALLIGAYHLLHLLIDKARTTNALLLYHSTRIVTCAIALFLSSHNKQYFQEFFSHELSKLWTLRDSSVIYKEVIRAIQNLVECCKIHSLVRTIWWPEFCFYKMWIPFQTDYNVNLPPSCCVDGEFKCINQKVQCHELYKISSIVFLIFILVDLLAIANTILGANKRNVIKIQHKIFTIICA